LKWVALNAIEPGAKAIDPHVTAIEPTVDPLESRVNLGESRVNLGEAVGHGTVEVKNRGHKLGRRRLFVHRREVYSAKIATVFPA